MNSNKILYWNRLRLQLNKWLFIFCGITLLIEFTFIKEELFTISLLPFEFTNILIRNVVDLLIYISLVNFIIIILELSDRIIDFKEQKLIKKYFKLIIIITFLSFPLLKMGYLIIVKFYK